MGCPGPSQLNYSFFFVDDNSTKLGRNVFFSLFASVNREKSVIPYVEAAVIGILMVAAIIENGAICWGVLAFKRLRRTANLMIVNLAVCAIFYMSTVSFIISARLKGGWDTGEVTCKITFYVSMLAGVVSLWTQMWIALLRFRQIRSHGMSRASAKFVLLLCGITWGVNAACLSPGYLFTHLVSTGFYYPESDEPILICTVSLPEDFSIPGQLMFVYMMVFGYVCPLIVILATYGHILKTLAQSNSRSKVFLTSTGRRHVSFRRSHKEDLAVNDGSTRPLSLPAPMPEGQAESAGFSNDEPNSVVTISDESAVEHSLPVGAHGESSNTQESADSSAQNVTAGTEAGCNRNNGSLLQMFKSWLPMPSKGENKAKQSRRGEEVVFREKPRRTVSRSFRRDSFYKKHIRSSSRSLPGTSKGENHRVNPHITLQKMAKIRHLKSTKILIALVTTFVLSWIPLFVVYTLQATGRGSNCYAVSSSAYVWALIAAYANACTNPIFYGFISRNFRVAINEACQGKVCVRKNKELSISSL